ncbi:MAG: MATE family efflux transporter [Clostridium sp.]
MWVACYGRKDCSIMEENILAKEKIPKLFMMYSIPAIMCMLIVGTQSIVDGIFVGNFVGETAMASVNIAQPFTQILAAASMVIVIGSLSYMGRSLGEKDIEKTQNIYRTSLILILAIASILKV